MQNLRLTKQSLIIAAIVTMIASISFIYIPELKAAVTSQHIVVDVDIQKEAQALVGSSPQVPLTLDKITSVREAIKHRHYAAAEKILADVLAHSKMELVQFSPFVPVMDGIPDTADPTFEQHMDEWMEQEKLTAILYLLRAKYYTDIAWQKRGERFDKYIQSENRFSFLDYTRKALADVNTAIQLNPNLLYGYELKLRILAGEGNTPEMKQAFQEAITKYPGYYQFYKLRLRTLAPKWGGSIEAMYHFVDTYAGQAPANSPLRILYLRLYANLMDAAWISCDSSDVVQRNKCFTSTMETIITPKLQQDVQSTFGLYKVLDRHYFSLSIKNILSDMVKTPDSEKAVGQISIWAGQSMGSDIQLIDKNPGHNNYVLDETVADEWKKSAFYDNAEKKYKEALLDLEADPFPDTEDNITEKAALYHSLADLYLKMTHYADAIVYETAADKLSGIQGSSYLICNAYYQLKNYNMALQNCTKVIDAKQEDDDLARVRRASIYEAQGKTDDALSDLTILADSESYFRTWAAIEMSVIYGKQNKLQQELALMNKYPYLFDETQQSDQDLAVAYNNRCYVYQHLGELEKALDDCNRSLKFGNLPDAYQKQQEILQRLNGKRSSRNIFEWLIGSMITFYTFVTHCLWGWPR